MITSVRSVIASLALVLTLNFNPPLLGRTPAASVVISIDRSFDGDGSYGFEISEHGSGPTGAYRRRFTFTANIENGVAGPKEFRDYQSAMTTEKAGVWRTRREPIAGYIHVFFQKGRPHAELRFIEARDGHSTKMSINGTYLLQVKRITPAQG